MKLIQILFFGLLFMLTCETCLAQTVKGKWKTYDVFDRNKEEAVVDIDIIDDVLYIKIDQIIPEEHGVTYALNVMISAKINPYLV